MTKENPMTNVNSNDRVDELKARIANPLLAAMLDALDQAQARLSTLLGLTRRAGTDMSTVSQTAQVTSRSPVFARDDVGRVIILSELAADSGMYRIGSWISECKVAVITLTGQAVRFVGAAGGTFEYPALPWRVLKALQRADQIVGEGIAFALTDDSQPDTASRRDPAHTVARIRGFNRIACATIDSICSVEAAKPYVDELKQIQYLLNVELPYTKTAS